MFGTKISDRFFPIATGGDIGFLTGVLKHLDERGWLDEGFIGEWTEGFEQLRSGVAGATWEELEAISGTSREEMLEQIINLKSGSLPADLEYIEEHMIGASLGAASIRSGLAASVGSLVLVLRNESGESHVFVLLHATTRRRKSCTSKPRTIRNEPETWP
jgi:predicted molibdopterin-dependent oxidoreductase YjgC